MTIDRAGLAEQVRTLRQARGLTQEELATMASISAHYIGNIEQGIRVPSSKVALHLCSALGTTLDQLFKDSLTEEMRQGRCVPVQDQHALRDSAAGYTNTLSDLLGHGMQSAALLTVPPHLITLVESCAYPLSARELLILIQLDLPIV